MLLEQTELMRMMMEDSMMEDSGMREELLAEERAKREADNERQMRRTNG